MLVRVFGTECQVPDLSTCSASLNTFSGYLSTCFCSVNTVQYQPCWALYKVRVLKVHPDKGGCAKKFREITEAKDRLQSYFENRDRLLA